MSKIVNIYPTQPITSVNPPIRGKLMGVRRTNSDIRACIIGRARVEEVLKDGRTVPLDFTNYDKDNSISEDAPVVEEIKTAPVLAEAPSLPAVEAIENDSTPAPVEEDVMVIPDAVETVEEVEVESEPEAEAEEPEEEPEEVEEAEVTEEVEEPVEESAAEKARKAIEAVETEVVDIDDEGAMEGYSEIESAVETEDADNQ